jgi:uncharacterized protein UPF0175
MKITIEIPDELAGQLIPKGEDPSVAVLEAIAVEGYRRDLLTESDIRKLLSLETRMEVHGVLKEHGAFLPYTVEDLAHDRDVARQAAQRAQAEQPGNRRVG